MRTFSALIAICALVGSCGPDASTFKAKDSGDGTITDLATGLTWTQAPSEHTMT